MNPKPLLCLALVLSSHCPAAIVYPQAPDGGQQIAYKKADEILRSEPSFLGGFRMEELTVGDPYQNYYVGLTDLASGHLLSAVRPGDWMYPLIHGTDIVGAAGLTTDKKTGKALRSDSLYQSNFSKETQAALRLAEQLPQIKQSDYEFRRLDDPGNSFVAIWLHGKSDDIIIPLPPTYGRMTAYQPCSEKQIIRLLQAEAKRDVAMWQKLDDQEQKNNEAYVKAMMDYEKSHGNKCGPISLYGMSAPYQFVEPHVETIMLQGTSTNCGKLDYRVKIIYGDNLGIVKQVEVLEKITQ
jgi:hypothetical protein